MKEHISKAELSRIAGVSMPAITKAIATGRVIEGRKGIDLSNPTNKLFIEKHKAERLMTPRKPVNGTKHGGASGKKEGESLFAQRIRADTELKKEQAATHRQRRCERLGLLTMTELVNRRLSVIGSEVKTRFLDLTPRIFPQLSALIKSGREEDAFALLEREIGEAIERVKEKATS